MRNVPFVVVHFLLLSSLVCLGAEPPISGPAEVPQGKIATLTLNLPNGGEIRRLKIEPAGLDVVKPPGAKHWYATGFPATYKITGELWYKKQDADKVPYMDWEEVEFDLRVTGATPPTPVPPVPPVPPGPTPDPTPVPGTSPFPEEGLRILFVRETAKEHELTPEQNLILYSKPLRQWYEAKVVKGPGDEPERRLYDPDIPVTGESATWQNVMKRPRASLPWMAVGNGKAGYEGPLPKTVAEFKKIVDQFAK